MDRLEGVKVAVEYMQNSGYIKGALIEDFNWLIDQAEKARQYEKALKDIYSRKREIDRSIGVLISKVLE